MRLYDIICALMLVGFLVSGLSCSKELAPPAISPAQECAMRCWTEGQGAGYHLGSKTDLSSCVCVLPLDE